MILKYFRTKRLRKQVINWRKGDKVILRKKTILDRRLLFLHSWDDNRVICIKWKNEVNHNIEELLSPSYIDGVFNLDLNDIKINESYEERKEKEEFKNNILSHKESFDLMNKFVIEYQAAKDKLNGIPVIPKKSKPKIVIRH